MWRKSFSQVPCGFMLSELKEKFLDIQSGLWFNNSKDKKLADKTDKIVEKKEKKLLNQEEKAKKPAVKSAKKFRKDTKEQREGKKYNPDPRTDSMNYSDKEAREFGKEMSGRSWSKKEALEASLHHDKALMNVPVAATAVAGTTASLISKRKNKSKKKGT